MRHAAWLILALSFVAFGQNGGPLVSITSPANGATFSAPANITINASASDTAGNITQVYFLNGSTLIGAASSLPYSVVWMNVPAGTYSLTAVAADDVGLNSTSSAVTVVVNGTTDQPPSVSMTSPMNGATFTAPATINLSANASDSDGTVTQVQFFAGSSLIGNVTSAPYNLTWSNVAAGNYVLTAQATDNAGLVTTSSAVNITVNAAPVYQGFLDVASCSTIGGWAWNANQPNTAINVDIYDGSNLVATTTASGFRQDLLNAGIGNGNHAFNISTPASVQDGNTHTISAKFSGTATSLSTSPKTVTCPRPGGIIQGFKVDGNMAQFNSPGATITIDGAQSFGPAVNPYTPSVTAGSHTVASNTPAGFSVSYSACPNCTDHTAAGGHPFVAGNSAAVNVSSGGYVDLWWKYAAADVPPAASITSPAGGASFTAPASIAIQAVASDSDGTVTKVDFLANGGLIGTVTAAPYNFAWTNVASGSYTLTARATDNAGLTTTSSPVTVNVNSGPVDVSTPRLDPSNRTGLPKEDLLSGNYNWSLALVGLKGRSGLDLSLALTYNSLVWTKSGSAIDFDADRGFPSPGFRLGFPVIQPRFFDPIVGANAYLLILPSGARVEVRQVGTTNIYESGDSSYIQVIDNGSSGLVALMPDGTQLNFQSMIGEFHCTQVKDRNGNFITINYNAFGHISSIVDTLARTINFNYDSSQLNLLQSITQTWNGAQHVWATFAYGSITLQTNFTGLSLVPVQNGQSINVLTQVTLADGSSNVFYYTSWGQVSEVQRRAADNHELTHVAYNLSADASVAQTDCPRFTQRRELAENWNGGAEVVTSFVFDPANLTGGQKITPDGTQYTESYGTSTWQRGLTIQTQTISGGVPRETTTTLYTQDDTTLAFKLNPRPIETNGTDDAGNHRRTTTTYTTFTLASGAHCSLPSDISEYAADASTLIRRTHTDYNLASAYVNARILGLPALVSVLDGNGVLASQVGSQYDQGVQDQGAVVQHDDANFGAGFVVGRGNLTGRQRFNAANPSQFLQSTFSYNTAGNLVSTTDPAGHQVATSYADSFSSGTAPGQTLAFPTSVTDPDGFNSSMQYAYDTGQVTLTQDPKGAQQLYFYDSAGRLVLRKYHDSVNNVDGTNTSYVYASSQNQVQIATLIDPGLASIITQFVDGAGRIWQTMKNFPGSSGGFSTERSVYDMMGRLVQQSNPTETDANGIPAGDDAGAPFAFRSTQYDWSGRPTRRTNQDGSISQVNYAGCACVGGLVTTEIDDAGRQTRTTYDILGQPVKTESLNADGTVYRTTTNVFDVLGHITNISEQQGNSGASQVTTRTYDPYGRLAGEHRPEQDPSASTTLNYYADGTIQSITDGRGAIKNYAYNNRRMPIRTTYTKPDGHTSPLEVDLSYDAAGNTLAMTDSAGSVTYVYDTWSRLLQETRFFNDINGGMTSFPLSYTYNLAGQLTSVTNPFSATVGYVYDSSGQLTTVTGSGFGRVTQFANGILYRAWSMPKHVSCGNNPRVLDLTYNTKQQVTTSNLSLNGTTVMGYSYTYNADGSLGLAQDLVAKAFDRAYLYDQVGRVTDAFSGNEARNLAVLPNPNGPYFEHMKYDEWDDLLRRNARIWSQQINPLITSYVNGRNSNWTYDADGNVTVEQDNHATFSYDVTGDPVTVSEPNIVIGRTTGITVNQSFDGNGMLVEQGKTAPSNFASHFVRSSVLGGRIISEVDSSGAETKTYIYQGGAEIAWHFPTTVEWVHHSLTGSSYQTSDSTGSLLQQVEFDQLGGRLPLSDPGPITLDFDRFDRVFPRVANETDLSGGCTVDFVPATCDEAQRLLNAGAGVFYNGPSVVWDPNTGMPLFPSATNHGPNAGNSIVFGSLDGSATAVYDPVTRAIVRVNPPDPQDFGQGKGDDVIHLGVSVNHYADVGVEVISYMLDPSGGGFISGGGQSKKYVPRPAPSPCPKDAGQIPLIKLSEACQKALIVQEIEAQGPKGQEQTAQYRECYENKAIILFADNEADLTGTMLLAAGGLLGGWSGAAGVVAGLVYNPADRIKERDKKIDKLQKECYARYPLANIDVVKSEIMDYLNSRMNSM